MAKATGKLEQKRLIIQKDMDNIIAYLTNHGETRRDVILMKLRLSKDMAKDRLDRLKKLEMVKTKNSSLGIVWALGKQEKFRKSPRKENYNNVSPINFDDYPKTIQHWLGYVKDFEPPEGRYIKETMPDIPTRSHKTTIGSGTCAHIDRLANL